MGRCEAGESMTPEQKFWELMRDHIPGHANRIENTVANGIPDINYCYHGKETWLELKAKPIIRKLDMVGNIIEATSCIRTTQYIWHRTRTLAGGKVLVLGRDEDKIVGLLATTGLALYRVMLIQEKPWNWEKIEGLLKGEYE